jgi:hypothetical protein
MKYDQNLQKGKKSLEPILYPFFEILQLNKKNSCVLKSTGLKVSSGRFLDAPEAYQNPQA